MNSRNTSFFSVLLFCIVSIIPTIIQAQSYYCTTDNIHHATLQMNNNNNLLIQIDNSPIHTLPFVSTYLNNGLVFESGNYTVTLFNNQFIYIDRSYSPVSVLIFQKTTILPPTYNTHSGETTTQKKITCRSCNGTGVCGSCNGTGYFRGYEGDLIKCNQCSASNGRKCNVCGGSGHW